MPIAFMHHQMIWHTNNGRKMRQDDKITISMDD
jgi:hypothetical protein